MAGATALLRRWGWHLKNTDRILRRQSTFKLWFILLFAAGMEIGLFLLFMDGFRYLKAMGPVGGVIVGRLFSLFFLGMGLMLVVSGIISSYATMFRSREIPFLLAAPFRVRQIVLYKFIESTLMSSWAFCFIVIPFLWAYAVHESLSWLFAFWAFLFSVPFLVLCSGAGTLLTMIGVSCVPAGRRWRQVLILVIIAAAFLLWGRTRELAQVTGSDRLDLARVVPGLKLASNSLLPNWWISEGMNVMESGGSERGLILLGLTLSWTMLLIMVVLDAGQALFYKGWLRVSQGPRSAGRKPLLAVSLERLGEVLPHGIRAMVMKDLRTFLRDPMQWSQALIFFGLLALYFSNLRMFRYHALADEWRTVITFLNVFSVSAVMCSLGSRFIYPQLSLEGQGFWVIGLSPLTMRQLVLTKFFVSAVALVLTGTALGLLSTRMLGVDTPARIVVVLLSVTIALGVCGLSTGLGAVFLDLEQQNPSAIVSGFGGTLNLVLNLIFMLLAIFPVALVFRHGLSDSSSMLLMRPAVIAAGGWLLFLLVLTVFVPLVLGIRSLMQRDY